MYEIKNLCLELYPNQTPNNTHMSCHGKSESWAIRTIDDVSRIKLLSKPYLNLNSIFRRDPDNKLPPSFCKTSTSLVRY